MKLTTFSPIIKRAKQYEEKLAELQSAEFPTDEELQFLRAHEIVRAKANINDMEKFVNRFVDMFLRSWGELDNVDTA
jgi:hypothetical protein